MALLALAGQSQVWASAGTVGLGPVGVSLCRLSAIPEHTVTPGKASKEQVGTCVARCPFLDLFWSWETRSVGKHIPLLMG